MKWMRINWMISTFESTLTYLVEILSWSSTGWLVDLLLSHFALLTGEVWATWSEWFSFMNLAISAASFHQILTSSLLWSFWSIITTEPSPTSISLFPSCCSSSSSLSFFLLNDISKWHILDVFLINFHREINWNFSFN